MKPTREPQWDLSQLRLLEQLAAEGSLTRVATKIGSPQPAVSRRLSKFERECGGKLFLRTGRGLQLSELGRQILPRAQAILREAEFLSREIMSHAAIPMGEVRVGVLPSMCDILLVPLYEKTRQRFPDILLNISVGSAGEVDQWLASGVIDLGVTLRYGARQSTDVERIAPMEAYVAGAPDSPLTKDKEIPFTRLHGVPLVLPSAPSATRLLLEQLARRHGINLNVVAEADSTQVQMAIASRGGAFVVMSAYALAMAHPSQALRSARIADPEVRRHIVMGLTAARPASQAAREVATMVRSLILHAKPPAVK